MAFANANFFGNIILLQEEKIVWQKNLNRYVGKYFNVSHLGKNWKGKLSVPFVLVFSGLQAKNRPGPELM